MNILRRKIFNNTEIGLLKAVMLAFGLVIGSHWPELFLPYTTELIGFGTGIGLYLAYSWFKQV